MNYHVSNIGKPYTDDWWARNMRLNIITAGYDGERGDRGEVILNQLEENDWIIAFANGHGYVGAGLVGPSSTYQLISVEGLPVGWESNHRHCRQVHWVYVASHLADAVSVKDAGRQAPRQTKEILPPEVGDRLIRLLAALSPDLILEKTFAELQAEFLAKVEKSSYSNREARLQRLRQAPKFPQRICVSSYAFVRNPDGVAEVLERANGTCQRCGSDAPFVKQSNGAPYLEVHHKIPLASNGQDTVENAIALCPNCHRELHYGQI